MPSSTSGTAEGSTVLPARGGWRLPRRWRSGGADIPGAPRGLHLVPLHLLGGSRVVDGVEHVKELDGFVPVAERCDGHGDPDGGMGILPAILADAREGAFDVP